MMEKCKQISTQKLRSVPTAGCPICWGIRRIVGRSLTLGIGCHAALRSLVAVNEIRRICAAVGSGLIAAVRDCLTLAELTGIVSC